MSAPYPPGAALDPETADDDFIAMRWRPVPPRRRGHKHRDDDRDSPPLEARWVRPLARRAARGEDELYEAFLRFSPGPHGTRMGGP